MKKIKKYVLGGVLGVFMTPVSVWGSLGEDEPNEFPPHRTLEPDEPNEFSLHRTQEEEDEPPSNADQKPKYYYPKFAPSSSSAQVVFDLGVGSKVSFIFQRNKSGYYG